MRIIGGQARGRRLVAPVGQSTRPTADRVRESLFNIMAPWVVDADFLDLYAGSGAVGAEALSRGARSTTFVEREAGHAGVIRANLESCGLAAGARVLSMDTGAALRMLATERALFTVVFVDPPYDAAGERGRTLLDLVGGRLLAPDGWAIVEGPARREPVHAAGLRLARLARYGDTALAFYRLEPQPGRSG